MRIKFVLQKNLCQLLHKGISNSRSTKTSYFSIIALSRPFRRIAIREKCSINTFNLVSCNSHTYTCSADENTPITSSLTHSICN